ncbi:major facilitator superfamily domain-containing protein [Sparassis latifolia]
MSTQASGTSTSVLDAQYSLSRTLQDKSETSTAIVNTEKTPCSVENGQPSGQCTVEDMKTPPSSEDEYLVSLDDEEDPKNRSTARKWVIVLVISSAALCATFASSVAAFTEAGLAEDLHTVHEVTILSISLFVMGLGVGPLLVGPLSEVYGRNIIYRISYLLFFAFTWPIAFAPNIEVFLVFRFITGFCGSAFLSVAGGSVTDLFVNAKVASPMAVYTMSPFIGPVIGPLIGGFINQNVYWRWTYRVLLMWQFVEIILLLLLIPETYEPLLLKSKARRMRKETGNDKYYAPLDRREQSIFNAILFSCYTPFQLILFDRMALALDTWNALILGILYLAFQAFPIIFEDLHGFNCQETGLSFLGIGVGMFAALATQPLWNRFHRNQTIKYNGPPPPETRLVMGQWGGILAPIGLFWLAFTTYKHVFWIAPIIASVPFGAGVYFIFTSTFTYLVVAYRPIAASAMAANSFLRSTFAAVFPLFATAMYHKLGTVGATALLAGLCTIMAPLPFIYRRIGGRLRSNSRFAVKS